MTIPIFSSSVNEECKNPRRVAAGRRNQLKRRPLSTESRQRLREAALRNKPWEYSTGPRTAVGKTRVASNGRRRQKGSRSVREWRSELADIATMIAGMSELRRSITTTASEA